MGEGPPSMREDQGRGGMRRWGSIFITRWQGVAPSRVRQWSRQAAWPRQDSDRRKPGLVGGLCSAGSRGWGQARCFLGDPHPGTFHGCFCSGRRRERKRGEKRQSVSSQAVLLPSESWGVLTFLLPAV